MKDNKIIVDIEDSVDLSKKLDTILINLDNLCENARKNGGIKYGKYQKGNFLEYRINLHVNMPSYSELVFFLSAVKDSNNTNKIITFVNRIMQKNQIEKIWLDEEMPMGLNASFALAYNEKAYISNFIAFLRTTDMNHEVYQSIFIELLENKWGICNQILELLAARTNSIAGQWGVEYHDALDLSNKYKKQYLNYLLKDILFSKRVHLDILVEGCNILGILIDRDRLNALFINRGAYAEPIFEMSDIQNIVETL